MAVSGLSMLLVGLGFAAVAGLVNQTQPQVSKTRSDLVSRIETVQTKVNALTNSNARDRVENERLRGLVLPDSNGTVARHFASEASSGGQSPLKGAGLSFTLNQLTVSTNPNDSIMDTDIAILVNGLWQSGAVAVDVNGIRLTGATSIRTAGGAILIDYQPVNAPYVVHAIGSRKMESAFRSSAAQSWLDDLVKNYPIGISVQWQARLLLGAGPMPVTQFSQGMEP